MSKKAAKADVPPVAIKKRPVVRPFVDKYEPITPTSQEDSEWGEAIVGRRVKVYWADWKNWYWGYIERFDAKEGTYFVRYDDGDTRWESWDYNFRVVKDTIDPTQAPASDVVWHAVPHDWPPHVEYASALIWADDPGLESRYQEHSTLEECSELRLNEHGTWSLFAKVDLPDTCLLDEFAGVLRQGTAQDAADPFCVHLFHDDDCGSLFIDASQRGNLCRFMRRLPRKSGATNCRFSHIILDGELRVFLELTRAVSPGDELVVAILTEPFVSPAPGFRAKPTLTKSGSSSPEGSSKGKGEEEEGETPAPQHHVTADLAPEVRAAQEAYVVACETFAKEFAAAAPGSESKVSQTPLPLQSMQQHITYEFVPNIVYDSLPDDHAYLRGRRCLWDFVYICKVTEKGHPCYGQYGCFANRDLHDGQYIGQYTGRVGECDGSSESMYVAKFVNAYDESSTENVRIDGEEYGNEMRFINDYRNTGREPSVQFILAWIGGTLQLMVVATRLIAADEELLIDYGNEYWDVLKEWEDWEAASKAGDTDAPQPGAAAKKPLAGSEPDA